MNPTQRLQTIIIGGSVAGLACAVDLVYASQKILLLEAKLGLGGRFASQDKLIAGFIRVIESHGGEIVTQTRVHELQLKADTDGYWVKTEWGTIKARNTVVALTPTDQQRLALPNDMPGLFRLTEDVANLQIATLAGQTLADAVLANNKT